MNKFIRYAIILAIVIVIIAGFYYLLCTVRTPEIDGVVIDKEKKIPVQNAWIMAVVETDTRTFGGDVSIHRLITRPHTRTDGEGKFTIPSHVYYSAPPPLGWGMRKTRLRIDVYAPGPKRGAIDIYTYRQVDQPVPQDKEASIKPGPSLKTRSLSVTIPVSHVTMSLNDSQEELGWLAGYCSHGRYRFAWPVMQGSCSLLETDYLIEAYENFLRTMGEPKDMNERVDSLGALGRLSGLYEKRGNYEKAYKYFIAFRDFGKKIGIDTSGDEKRISRLREKIKEQQKEK
jgi:hypothetical protein